MSDAGSPPAPRVAVGAVSKAFGIRGEVYVHPDPDVGDDFPVGRTYAAVRGNQTRELTVAASRDHGGRRVVRFAGVDDRTAAEELRGWVLEVGRDELELDADAFWSADLLGAEVVDRDGALVGVLERILDGVAHDYFVIALPDANEVLVPAVAELTEIVDGRLVIDAIPGLLDPPEPIAPRRERAPRGPHRKRRGGPPAASDPAAGPGQNQDRP